jgi:hypothetical protein
VNNPYVIAIAPEFALIGGIDADIGCPVGI